MHGHMNVQKIRKFKSPQKSKKKPAAASKILEIPNCYTIMRINTLQPCEKCSS
jgi:hypothetical protein